MFTANPDFSRVKNATTTKKLQDSNNHKQNSVFLVEDTHHNVSVSCALDQHKMCSRCDEESLRKKCVPCGACCLNGTSNIELNIGCVLSLTAENTTEPRATGVTEHVSVTKTEPGTQSAGATTAGISTVRTNDPQDKKVADSTVSSYFEGLSQHKSWKNYARSDHCVFETCCSFFCKKSRVSLLCRHSDCVCFSETVTPSFNETNVEIAGNTTGNIRIPSQQTACFDFCHKQQSPLYKNFACVQV